MLKEQMDECKECPIVEVGRRQFMRSIVAGAVGLIAAPSLARASSLVMGNAHLISASEDLRTYAIPAADSVQIDHDSEVILVRWENNLFAFNLSCPHQHTALRWVDGAKHFQCPKHRSQYTPGGEFIKGRATRGMDRLGVKKDGDNIVVDLDSYFRQDQNPAGWSTAMITLS